MNEFEEGAFSFKALFVALGDAEIDAVSATGDETIDELGERVSGVLIFVGLGPFTVGGPMTADDLGVGEGLIEAFVPRFVADVEPKLIGDRFVAEEIGEGGRKEHGLLFFVLPTADVLGGDDPFLDHGDVFFVDVDGLVRLVDEDGTEFFDGFDDVGSDDTGIEILMEFEAFLGDEFSE